MAKAWIGTCLLLALTSRAAIAQAPAADALPVRLGAPNTGPVSTMELPLAPPQSPPALPPPPALPALPPIAPLSPPVFDPPSYPSGPVSPVILPATSTLIQLNVRQSATTGSSVTAETTSACVWDAPAWRVFDNLSLFAGLNIAKEPADLGVNENFGYRFAVNWGLPLVER